MTVNNYLKNKKKLEEANVSITDHDACGVGFVASMTGKPKREVVENGIEALFGQIIPHGCQTWGTFRKCAAIAAPFKEIAAV